MSSRAACRRCIRRSDLNSLKIKDMRRRERDLKQHLFPRFRHLDEEIIHEQSRFDQCAVYPEGFSRPPVSDQDRLVLRENKIRSGPRFIQGIWLEPDEICSKGAPGDVGHACNSCISRYDTITDFDELGRYWAIGTKNPRSGGIASVLSYPIHHYPYSRLPEGCGRCRTPTVQRTGKN